MEDQQLHITLRMTGLLAGYLRNSLSETERHELEQWLAANERNREVLEEMLNEEKAAEHWRKLAYYRERTEKARLELAAEIERRAAFRRRRLFFYKAAAAAVLLFCVAYVFLALQLRKDDARAVVTMNVMPGSQKAQLVLSNGKSLELNTGSDTSFIQGASVKIQQQQGLLAYEDLNNNYEDIQFHQLITPKGGEYHLLLEDGTHVWLNAASSIRFPTRFGATERRVQLTGEAYFEVAKDAEKPFIVAINEKTSIEVLGTRFNVNAYTDEDNIHTTLLEGAVAVTSGNDKRKIIPGQRTVTKANGSNAIIIEQADTVRAVAWRYGVFDFNDTKLSEVMRQVSRWYNIDVVYEKGIPDIKVWGRMERNQDLQQLIRILNGMDVRVKLESINKLTVLQ
jgi:ferric-dicitrate binding protein FerR (iron transport regulator)